MLARFRSHLSFANVASALALFVALSTGGAYATHLVVDSSDVVDNSLTGGDVRGKSGNATTPAVNGSLITDDIGGQPANPANGTPFIDGSLTQWDIKNGALVGGDLANNTVSGGKIADSSLTGLDVSNSSLTGADVDESTLSQVPSALTAGLGGIGRWDSPGGECNPDSLAFFTCAVTTIDLPTTTRVLVTGTVKAQSVPPDTLGRGQCRLATNLGAILGTLAGFDAGNGQFAKFVPLIGITAPVGPGPVAFGTECREMDPDVTYFDPVVAAVALSPSSPFPPG
jgi:hypothetical protein